jgi:type III secretory pathway component EscU
MQSHFSAANELCYSWEFCVCGEMELIMKLLSKIIENLKKLEKFSIHVIVFGLKLSIGLIILSAIFYTLMGRYGDYMSALNCARGALQAAPAVIVSAVAAALISDIVIKERTQHS